MTFRLLVLLHTPTTYVHDNIRKSAPARLGLVHGVGPFDAVETGRRDEQLEPRGVFRRREAMPHAGREGAYVLLFISVDKLLCLPGWA